MKKFIIGILLCFLMSAQSFATTLPSGTLVTVQPTKKIDADKVKEGDLVEFVVNQTVKNNNDIFIKAGAIVIGQVTKKKNNFILGVPGELHVGNFRVEGQNGEIINLRGNIIDEGDNRYWAHIGWFFLFPILFVKGDDGFIQMNSTHLLYTIEDVNL